MFLAKTLTCDTCEHLPSQFEKKNNNNPLCLLYCKANVSTIDRNTTEELALWEVKKRENDNYDHHFLFNFN